MKQVLTNYYSKQITCDPSHSAAQAMLLSTPPFTKQRDYDKLQNTCFIGVGTMAFDSNPCNYHLSQLSAKLIQLINFESTTCGFGFNTIGVSDGITMGTLQMRYSLASRELIADSIETVGHAHFYDSLVLIPGCDKNLPASVMGALRLNRPTIIAYGGSIAPGCSPNHPDRPLDIVSAFESYGKYLTGKINDIERIDIVKHACPGPGSCGGMYTANTMSSIIEVMGLSFPNSSSIPAGSVEKEEELLNISKLIHKISTDPELYEQIKPLNIINRQSLLNGIVLLNCLGGSTNAVLHLLAIANEIQPDLITLSDFNEIREKTMVIANLKPHGEYLMNDVHKYAGGLSSIIKYLIDLKLIDGNCMTITGKSLYENVKYSPNLIEYNDDFFTSQKIIYPVHSPFMTKGHVAIIYGNVCPEGAVLKINKMTKNDESVSFRGPAVCFNGESDSIYSAIESGRISEGVVVVIRYVGPKGGPGMSEMLAPTSAIAGAGLAGKVALMTDGRFSGGSHGCIVGHICPEAVIENSPISKIRDGDDIEISVNQGIVNHTENWENRMDNDYVCESVGGYLGKFKKLVSSASMGCVTTK